MAISLVPLIGLAAAACTTVAYLPQVIRVLRTKSTTDISLGMFSIMTLGVVLWLTYGIAIGDLPIILANTVTLVLVSTILITKLRNG